MFVVKKKFCQTITMCDRIKHSNEEYENVFAENIRFSVYIEISESRDIRSWHGELQVENACGNRDKPIPLVPTANTN